MKKFSFHEIRKYIIDLNEGNIFFEDLPEEFKLNKNEIKIPEYPREPSNEECCGSGCNPCVFDIYQSKIEKFDEEIEKICTLLNSK